MYHTIAPWTQGHFVYFEFQFPFTQYQSIDLKDMPKGPKFNPSYYRPIGFSTCLVGKK